MNYVSHNISSLHHEMKIILIQKVCMYYILSLHVNTTLQIVEKHSVCPNRHVRWCEKVCYSSGLRHTMHDFPAFCGTVVVRVCPQINVCVSPKDGLSISPVGTCQVLCTTSTDSGCSVTHPDTTVCPRDHDGGRKRDVLGHTSQVSTPLGLFLQRLGFAKCTCYQCFGHRILS